MKTINHYVIVDDDPFNNMICSMTIKKALGDVNIITFTEPEKGLEYFQKEFNNSPAILLLDINMPTLTGWDFMEHFERFDEELKKVVHVYILSSSVDDRDKEKAAKNRYIKGFFSKPLLTEDIFTTKI